MRRTTWPASPTCSGSHRTGTTSGSATSSTTRTRTGGNYTYAGNRFLAGGQYTLPGGSTRLRYDFDLHQRNYQNQNTLLPAVNPNSRKRYDLEQNHVFRIEQVLAQNLGPTSIGCAPTAPCPLTLAAELLRTVANSNLAVYDYVRNVWSLSLSWRY